MSGLIRIGEQLPLDGVVEFHATHLEFKRELTKEEWLYVGKGLKQMDLTVQWWIGDWWKRHIAYGEGEGLAELAGLKYEYCRNVGSVSEAFELSSRDDNLSFHHHRLAMAAPPEEREDWLKKAKENRWTVKRLTKEIKVSRNGAQAAHLPGAAERYELIHSEFQAVELPGPVDFIVTDPPYPEEFLPLYDDLAVFADKCLKDGGSLLCMVGQSFLPTILHSLQSTLEYQWMLCYQTLGAATQMWDRKIHANWKPILWFTKGQYQGDWIPTDVVKSEKRDKDHHEWGQSESGMIDLVKRFTKQGQMIVDPFCGAGTTGIAALACDCLFTGIDSDENSIASSKIRLHEACTTIETT